MRLLPALLCVCLLLSGCDWLPQAREMGDMALLRTMGVDQEEDGVLVTVSTGPRARGLQGDQEPALTLSAQRLSLSAAALSIQGLSDNYVFFGYVDQLILGDELVRRGITPVLDYFARDVELSLGAQLWVARDATAADAVYSGGDQGVESRLSTLQTDGELGTAAIARTAGEVYADLLELGAAYVPALVASGGDEVTLIEGGYAVLKGDKLVGFLEGEQARGLELLAGKPSADILEGDAGGQKVTARVSGASMTCRLLPEGGLSLTCRVAAHLVEYDTPPSHEDLERLERQLAEREKARIQGALEQLRDWEADCTGLGAKAALSAPGRWSTVEDDWARVFAQQEPELAVYVELQE